MYIFDKIVVSTTEPKDTIVLWYNPLDQDLYYYNDGWTSVHEDFIDLLNTTTTVLSADIASLQSWLTTLDTKVTGDIVSINGRLFIIESDLKNKQNIIEPSLITSSKTIPGSINELSTAIRLLDSKHTSDISSILSSLSSYALKTDLGFVWNSTLLSHAFGDGTNTAFYPYSTSFGIDNHTNNNALFVVGKYADPQTNALFTVGNGLNSVSRYNAFSVTDNGNFEFGDGVSKVVVTLLDFLNLVDLYSYILTVFPEIPTLPDYSSELASINDALLKKANVSELEALENNIFAADGGITDTFINAMMLQIGADSMNYELSHTITHADGTHSNYDIISNVFTINKVAGGENLIHFVYYWKDSSNNYHINWKISNGISVPLTAPLTYYVCIKCDRLSDSAEWVCDTTLHKVDEDPAYWYFNYGIIMYVNGKYTLKETRGCSYMYGDNIITGKIKSLSGASWFDLNNGEFVLGETVGSPALSFQNGMLSIGGYDEKFTELEGAFNNALNDYDVNVQELFKSMQSTLEGLDESFASMSSTIAELQKQADGLISNYFGQTIPSDSSYPVLGTEEDAWLKIGTSYTSAEKDSIYNLHAGDTYTNISEGGYSYKWVKNGSTWEWMVITDSAVLAALEELKESLAVAIDGKSTTFYDVFPSNYKKGDVWILTATYHHTNGKAGEIWNAVNKGESYNANDWAHGVAYADKDVVETLSQSITGLEADLKSALQGLNDRVKAIEDLNSDNIITKKEVTTLTLELLKILAEELDTSKEYALYKGTSDLEYNKTPYYTNYQAYLTCLNYFTNASNWVGKSYLTIPTNTTDPHNLKVCAKNYYDLYVLIRSTILERAKEYLESFTQSAVLKYFGDMTIGGTNLYPNSENLFNPSLGNPVLGRFWSWAPEGKTQATTTNVLSKIEGDSFDGENGSCLVEAKGGNYQWKTLITLKLNLELEISSKYTVTCKIKNDSTCAIKVNCKLRLSSEISDNYFKDATALIIQPNEEKVYRLTGYPYNNGGHLLLFVGTDVKDETKDIKFRIKQIKLEKGGVPTEWSPAPTDFSDEIRSYYFLKQAFEGTTDIQGGAVFCNQIHLRNAEKDVTAGINGLEDNTESEGVALWCGGDYKDASDWAIAHNKQTLNSLTNTLPVILTKTGKGSKLGPLEIEDLNTACIYNTNRTSRILLSTNYGPDSNTAILTQVKEGGVWVTKAALTDGSIQNTFKSVSLTHPSVVFNERKAARLAVSVNTTLDSTHSWKLNCNKGHILNLQLLGMRAGGFALTYASLKLDYEIKVFVDGSSTPIYSSGLLTIQKDTKEHNDSHTFSDALSKFPSFLNKVNNLGKIKSFKIQIEFIRVWLKVGGVWYDYDFNDPELRNFKVKWYFNNNLSFVSESTETKGVHLGKDGIKVVIDNNKIFAVRNKDSYIDVNIQGLPNSSSVSLPGLLYQDGNYLKIKS